MIGRCHFGIYEKDSVKLLRLQRNKKGCPRAAIDYLMSIAFRTA